MGLRLGLESGFEAEIGGRDWRGAAGGGEGPEVSPHAFRERLRARAGDGTCTCAYMSTYARAREGAHVWQAGAKFIVAPGADLAR